MRLLASLALLSVAVSASEFSLSEYYSTDCSDGTKFGDTKTGTTGWGCTEIQDPQSKRMKFENAGDYIFTYFTDDDCSKGAWQLKSPDGCKALKDQTFFSPFTHYKVCKIGEGKECS
ncbi:hypothetical protein NUU61_004273 [Penicillium alfredii]|uniref:Uncharacterized protein n=1 Tax=Penicillium alfredii TaxID=1506179 RepID=A0A9W9FKT6_9EURO|nr:uncharacterized protein NUU61_004273 [Penicillium alfredii]KAJ5102051.1 hypothetical protein NUU61_004273 [Penicillium alfredii]